MLTRAKNTDRNDGQLEGHLQSAANGQKLLPCLTESLSRDESRSPAGAETRAPSSANGGPSAAPRVCCSPRRFAARAGMGISRQKGSGVSWHPRPRGSDSRSMLFSSPILQNDRRELIALTPARRRILPLLQHNKGQ